MQQRELKETHNHRARGELVDFPLPPALLDSCCSSGLIPMSTVTRGPGQVPPKMSGIPFHSQPKCAILLENWTFVGTLELNYISLHLTAFCFPTNPVKQVGVEM